MISTAKKMDPLIAFVLPGVPESAGVARCHVRVALDYHGLGDYGDDAAVITSELVSNAVLHADMGGTETLAVTLTRVRNSDAVVVVVADSSPHPPVRQEITDGSERGRGLQVIEALSAYWGWNPVDGGKEVFAVLMREA